MTDVRYSIHKKEGSPDSLRVDYYSGLRRIASEFVCFEHTGWARAKAERWWLNLFNLAAMVDSVPKTAEQALELLKVGTFLTATKITINENGKYPEIISVSFDKKEHAA